MDSPTTLLRKITTFASRHRFSIITVIASALLGVLSASLIRDTDVSVLDGPIRWELPQNREAQLSTDLDTMLAEPFFGGEPVLSEKLVVTDESTSSEEAEKDKWRFIGIVAEGNTKHVVIFNDTAGKTELTQLGQTLPGGEELITIGPNDIEILDSNERRWLSLFVDNSAKEQE